LARQYAQNTVKTRFFGHWRMDSMQTKKRPKTRLNKPNRKPQKQTPNPRPGFNMQTRCAYHVRALVRA
jgi:hypothetical protein